MKDSESGDEIEETELSIGAGQGMHMLFAHRNPETGELLTPEMFNEREAFERDIMPLLDKLLKACDELKLPILTLIQFSRIDEGNEIQSEGVMAAGSNPADLRAGILHRGIYSLIHNPTALTIQPTIQSMFDMDDLFLGEDENGTLL